MSRTARMALIGLVALVGIVVVAEAAPLDRVTELVSTGPLDGGTDSADTVRSQLSGDGAVVAFATPEPLTVDDEDTDEDVYLRSAGITTLVSTSPQAGGPDSANAGLEELSADGTRVYIDTLEPLLPADGDIHRDIYVWEGGALTLVSDGPQAGGGDSADAFFDELAGGGSIVLFRTAEPLVAGDPDNTIDLYRATPTAGGGFDLAYVSGGAGDGGMNSASAGFAAVSDDGQHVFFSTDEPLEGDTDADSDLYRRSGGTTTLLSGGPMNGGGDSAGIGFFAGGDVSADGLSKGFFTSEQLAADDTDLSRDLYRGSGGQPQLVSEDTAATVDPVAQFAGGFDFFQTADSLVAADTDTDVDVYAASNTAVRLVSDGPLAGGADSADVVFGATSSADGTRVLFATPEPLVPEDTDGDRDVYEREGELTRLLSGGPLAGGPDSASAFLTSGARDGSRWFFGTSEPLTSDDTDSNLDFYEYSEGEIRLVTTGPRAGGADSEDASLGERTSDGSALLFETAEPLVDLDTDETEDVYLVAPPPPPPPPPPPVVEDSTDPVISALRVRPARFRLGRKLPSIARRVRTGTTIRLRLSEAAGMRLTFARVRPGRRVRGRCRKPTRRNRSRRRCTRHVRVRGAISLPGTAGPNRIRFQGRLNRRRKLRPGRYRLTIRATDDAGNRSSARSARFRLLPRRARRR